MLSDFSGLNEKIQKEKQQPNAQKYGAAINPPPGPPSEAPDKSSRRSLVGQLFAKAVKRKRNRVPNETSPSGTKFVDDPNWDVKAIGPKKRGSSHENRVTENRENA